MRIIGGVSGIMGGAWVIDNYDIDDSCNEEDHEIHNVSGTSSSKISILENLKSPTPSDFARKRKLRKNPPVGKKRSRGVRGVNDPKSITPSQRVKEFSDECLKVSNNKLFCTGSREELSIRKV